MKTKFCRGWKAVLVLAGLPFVAAYLSGEPADEPKPGESATNSTILAAPAEMPGGQLATNQAVPVAATGMQPSGPALPNLQLYGGTAEIVKLAQSGADEGVMLTYISNAPVRFSLGSDQIIYLNDLGVSSSVVTAMLEHDAAQNAAGAITSPTNSVYPPGQTDLTAYPPAQTADQPVPATATDYADYYAYPPADFSTPDDTAYFYNTLAPYGSWINVAGYGLCWQPVVYVRNHDWRPYNDNGRWLYSDCGWYWQSDYSWGWAAFHYGRWLRDANTGWVWLPNRVWSPAWVSWRSSAKYAGWAPLPPSANFVPGAGFRFQNHAVDASFEFGLHRGLYTFIPTERLADYSPGRYRISGTQSVGVFNQTAVINNVATVNHQVVSHSIDPARVEALSGSPIRRAVIRELPAGSKNGQVQPDRLDKRGDSLVVFRPQLPATSVNRSGLNPGAAASVVNGAPKTASVVSAANPAATRPVSGAPTTAAGFDRDGKSYVQVYVRQEPPPPGPTVITPATARTAAAANTVSLPPQPGRSTPQTFTVYQRPDLSGNTPPPSATSRVVTSHEGSSSRVTVYQRPDLSANVQSDQGTDSRQLPARGNYDYSRGYGNQYSPPRATGQPQPSPTSSPAQAPVQLPYRGYGNYSYSQPANNSAPAYSQPASRPAAAPAYNPQPQPIQLPPSHSQSAPAPAPAPAPASHSSSSQSSSSQSSSSQSSGRR